MPQHVPSPACCLLRGDRKHLFIVLCIIDHSIILITSFPQDSSEMVYLFIIGEYPILRTLDSYLSTLSDFLRPPFHRSFPSTCLGQVQCYQRRKVIGHAYVTSMMKTPLLIIWGYYLKALTPWFSSVLMQDIYISYQGQGFGLYPYLSPFWLILIKGSGLTDSSLTLSVLSWMPSHLIWWLFKLMFSLLKVLLVYMGLGLL